MSGNAGAWGIAMWKDGYSSIDAQEQEQGISLEGGDPVLPYLPTDPVGTLLVPPFGMGVPAVRSGDVAFAQRDGVVQFADYYEPRQLTFQVLVKNDDCPGCSSSPEIPGALVLNGTAPGRAYTSDKAALDIVGDIEITVHLAMADWTPVSQQTITGKWGVAGNRSYALRVAADGTPRLSWTADGTTILTGISTVSLSTMANGAELWVRATLDVNNGAAGRDIRFYTSTNGVTWTQLGATVTQAGVTSIFAGTAPLEVGSDTNGTANNLIGNVFYVEVRDGIGGTVVANPDFEQPQRYSSFEDDAGNVWFVISPAVLQPFQAERRTARQKVSRLTQEWSRNCSGASLVLFTDCHNPDADEEEKIYNGPYLVHGRPRVADVVWERSNRGAARVTLRFDATDARLVLVDAAPGQLWDSEHVQTIDADEQNLAPDADLSGLTMTLNGATVQDSHPTSGGPLGGDGGPYFNRFIEVANVSSPMVMALGPTGTAAIPVNPGDVLSIAFWARKDPGGGPTPRADYTWYNAGGAVISTHNGTAQAATATWQRFTQPGIVAPALAEFVQVRLAWSGIALVGQNLGLAQAWINRGAVSTSPETVEIVGTLCVYPVISLFPNLTAPIVVTYGNHEFTYTQNVTSVIDIDTQWGRASQGFTDVTENVEGDFTSPLEPGIHTVTVQTANPADTGFVNVVWENAVVAG